MDPTATQASELRYRRLFESAQDGILILDGQTGAIVDANPYLTDNLGYSRDELLGKMLWELGTFVDTDAAKAAFVELETKGYIRYEDLDLRRKDGSLMQVEFISNAYDVEGERVYQCNIRDITARRQLENAARIAHERFRALIENSSDLTAVVSADGVITYVSPSIRAVAGYEMAEVLHRNFLDFVVADDQQAAVKLLAALQGHKNRPIRYQLRYRHKDDSSVDLEGVAIYLPDTPGINGIVANLRDVTDRKKAEAEVRSKQQLLEGILNAIPVRVFWKDKNLVYLGCNASFAQDAGFADPQELVGKDDRQMPWDDQVDLYQADDREVIDSGQAKMLIEEPQTTPDGKLITLLTSKVPLRDDQGQVIGVLGTYMDITKRKEQDIALQRSVRALKALSAVNSALVHATNEEQLYADMLRILVEIGGYRMAWVGLLEADNELPIRPVGVFGDATNYVPSLNINLSGQNLSQYPAGQCVRLGRPAVSHDIGLILRWLLGGKRP